MHAPIFHTFPAPAKLNLTLLITGKRDDGYHLLDTDFRFIDLCDSIDIAVRDDGVIELLNPMPDVPADSDLTVRAARLLQQATGSTQGATLRVHKRIPMGGGLGGGSSDAGARTVLLALNRLVGLRSGPPGADAAGRHAGRRRAGIHLRPECTCHRHR